MAEATFVNNGDSIPYIALADLAAGTPILVGDLVGVVNRDTSTGETATLELKGSWRVTLVDGQAATQGEKAYWDNTAKRVTAVAADFELGHFANSVSAGTDEVCEVRLSNPAA